MIKKYSECLSLSHCCDTAHFNFESLSIRDPATFSKYFSV